MPTLVFHNVEDLARRLYRALSEASPDFEAGNQACEVKRPQWELLPEKIRNQLLFAAEILVRQHEGDQETCKVLPYGHRKFYAVNVRLEPKQISKLETLSHTTGIPFVEYVRRGVDLILEKTAEEKKR